jgi:hypothetical protein
MPAQFDANDDFPDNFAATFVPANATIRLEGWRGDTISFQRQAFKDASGNLVSIDPTSEQPPAGLAPQDLTGWTVTATAKRSYSDPDNQAVMQVDNASLGGIVIALPTTGRLGVSFPAMATRLFPDWRVDLYVDVKGVDPGGLVRTLGSGVLTIDPNVTRLF